MNYEAKQDLAARLSQRCQQAAQREGLTLQSREVGERIDALQAAAERKARKAASLQEIAAIYGE